MNGFIFGDHHSGAFGVQYRPDAKARGDEMEDYEINDLTPDNRDGGYYIGTRVKPRTFEQDCFFEDIRLEQQEQIYRWLGRGNRGRLIFDRKPHVFYEVVPSKKISISLYDHVSENGERLYSGTFTAVFACYEPFGKLLRTSYPGACGEIELASTGILPSGIMPAQPGANGGSFLMYNPGTERAHTIVRLAGDVGDGLLIRNLTTAQRCKIISLTDASLVPGACLELDSAMGQTRIALGDQVDLAYPFHDEGYIELAPCTPFIRAAEVTHAAGSNIISSPALRSRMTGQYVYIDGWRKLSQASEGSAIVSQAIGTSGTTQTPIVTMNEIQAEGAGMAQTRFEIEYTPRVR